MRFVYITHNGIVYDFVAFGLPGWLNEPFPIELPWNCTSKASWALGASTSRIFSVSPSSAVSAGKLRHFYQIKDNVICKKNNSMKQWCSHELYTLLCCVARSKPLESTRNITKVHEGIRKSLFGHIRYRSRTIKSASEKGSGKFRNVLMQPNGLV